MRLSSRTRYAKHIKDMGDGIREIRMRTTEGSLGLRFNECLMDYFEVAVHHLLDLRFVGDMEEFEKCAKTYRIVAKVKPHGQGYILRYKGICEAFRKLDVAIKGAEKAAELFFSGSQIKNIQAMLRELRIKEDFKA